MSDPIYWLPGCCIRHWCWTPVPCCIGPYIDLVHSVVEYMLLLVLCCLVSTVCTSGGSPTHDSALLNSDCPNRPFVYVHLFNNFPNVGTTLRSFRKWARCFWLPCWEWFRWSVHFRNLGHCLDWCSLSRTYFLCSSWCCDWTLGVWTSIGLFFLIVWVWSSTFVIVKIQL